MARTSSDLTRERLERDEDLRLSPCALRSAEANRSRRLDPEGRVFDYRTEFQRDRDRILHARAFRRLRLKSAGGAFPPAERFRDRLTHTLEVSQLSRTAARGLGLNEDLVEAIALGHELGMPPFARAGEAALDSLLGRKAGGFRCNVQSLRVVDTIEKRYAHPGLNLTDSVREGILKHASWAGLKSSKELRGLKIGRPAFLEAQLVAKVDAIASAVQDLDDGLRSGELETGMVEALPIVRELLKRIGPARGSLHMRANTINRGLTHMLVAGLVRHSRRSIRAWMKRQGVTSHEGFVKHRDALREDTIGLTPPAARLYDGLRDFVARHLHEGAWLRGVGARAGNLIAGLFGAISRDPRLADDYLLLRFKEESGGPYLRDLAPGDMDAEIARRYRGNPRFARLVADHIAGMTDMFAVAEYERLVGPVALPGGGR